MDIREQQQPKQPRDELLDVDASNESLIYNLVKRVDLRNQILTGFQEATERSSARWIDRTVHHRNVLIWFGLAAAYTAYRRRTLQLSVGFNMPTALFHGVALLSLNEYYKKQRALELEPKLATDYKEV